MQQMLNSHPCILELKSLYTETNMKYLRENRLNTLKCGEVFPYIRDMVKKTIFINNEIMNCFQKIIGNIFVQLHKNERALSLYEYDIKAEKKKGLLREILIKDITHLAMGKNCRHKDL